MVPQYTDSQAIHCQPFKLKRHHSLTFTGSVYVQSTNILDCEVHGLEHRAHDSNLWILHQSSLFVVI